MSKRLQQLLKTIYQFIPYLLVLAPILAHWGFWNVYKTYWGNTDPSTWYFLDSLSVFAGKSYTFIDHPGTPVQIIGSLFLALTIPFIGSGQDLIDYYIARPEAFFFMMNLFLVVIGSLTVILLYRLAAKVTKTNSVFAGIAVSLVYFAIHPLSTRMLTYWQHNALYFPLGTLWWILVYRKIMDGKFSNRDGFLFGVAAGILANIQIFFIPFIASSVLVSFLHERQKFQSFKKGLTGASYAILGNLAGIIAMILPVYRELPRFWKWISGIVFSESLYGDGRESFFTVDALLFALSRWRTDNADIVMFGALLLAGLLIGLYLYKKENTRLPANLSILLVVLLVQVLFLVVLITRGYARPRYSLALAALLPVLFLAVLQLFDLSKRNPAIIRLTIFAAIVVGAFQTTHTGILHQHEKHLLEVELAADRSVVINLYARQHNLEEDDVVIVYAYGTPLKCASLVLANDWLALFDREISVLCPNQYAIYTDGASVNLNSNRKLTDIKNIDWDVVVSSGEPTFLTLLDNEKIKYVPGAWGITRRSWFLVEK